VKRSKPELVNLKKNVNLFLEALKKEGIETRSISKNIRLSLIEKRKLTETEHLQVTNQLKNIMKTIGLTTIFLMPGGIVFFMLLKYLKVMDYLIPTSFDYLKNKDI